MGVTERVLVFFPPSLCVCVCVCVWVCERIQSQRTTTREKEPDTLAPTVSSRTWLSPLVFGIGHYAGVVSKKTSRY